MALEELNARLTTVELDDLCQGYLDLNKSINEFYRVRDVIEGWILFRLRLSGKKFHELESAKLQRVPMEPPRSPSERRRRRGQAYFGGMTVPEKLKVVYKKQGSTPEE